ncbi:DUF4129 domain-containing protein [Paenibacillus sp. GD4]|uniref:DUF4129 domain-containing protein n=1 Tax=Paenibacillus sp. GD4 TaxID=3068890 RepID=UPI002796B71B|nr:DUF4129 domain-containing protein [Paenibacillus sp. GD4]MDQ1912056.1 DUF4129 domain-containing protein [Paenibacillus sp. GD4]
MTIQPIIRSWSRALFELLLLLPLWLLVNVYILPEKSLHWLIGLAFLSLVGVLTGNRLRYHWSRGLTAIALGGLFALAVTGTDWRALLTAPPGIAAVLLGLRATSGSRSEALHWVGITGYLLAAFFFRYWPELETKLSLLTWAGMFCLIIVVFTTNSRFLRYASLSKNKASAAAVPAAIRTHNRWYVGGVLAVSIGLAALAGSYMGQLLWSFLRVLLGWLFRSTPKEMQRVEQQPAAPSPPMGLPQEEPGLLSYLLNLLFYTVCALVLAALLGYALYWLYRNSGEKLRAFAAKIISMLRREAPKENQQGYVDIESGVFSWESARRRWREVWLDRVKGGVRDRWEDQVTNRDRIRYLYREWLRVGAAHGYEKKPYLTPKETGDELLRKEAAERRKRTYGPKEETAGLLLKLYYRVRYAAKDVTDEEVERARQWK